jgi:hypothetical protein
MTTNKESLERTIKLFSEIAKESFAPLRNPTIGQLAALRAEIGFEESKLADLRKQLDEGISDLLADAILRDLTE